MIMDKVNAKMKSRQNMAINPDLLNILQVIPLISWHDASSVLLLNQCIRALIPEDIISIHKAHVVGSKHHKNLFNVIYYEKQSSCLETSKQQSGTKDG